MRADEALRAEEAVPRVRRALISVADKTGVVELARRLAQAGVEILSSGGTAAALTEAGINVTQVSEATGAPEMLDGRVKTLHPKIHAAILADRRRREHIDELAEHDIEPIDLVICNLYPFESTITDPHSSEDDALEQIDIGGPAMVRAAAKNFRSVAVVVDPRRYAETADRIRSAGGLTEAARRELAVEAFRHTAAYDATISSYLAGEDLLPEKLVVAAEKALDLRYGENPHQGGAFYRRLGAPAGFAAGEQLQGKHLSYNNLLDADAAWRLASELDRPASVIVKHATPCGVAVADSIHGAHLKALDCDRTSAFGGVVALNRECDRAAAEAITEVFTEVVIAPSFEDDALAVLGAKKALRVLRLSASPSPEPEVRSVGGGFLVQLSDPADSAEDARVVTAATPTGDQWDDLRFAWVVVKHVKSNAIVLAKDGMAVGVGAGQMSRVDATRLAALRAGERAKGSVCASDAFFPFRDGVDAAAAAGVTALIQPGGSVRDDEVIAAADEHGVAMVFTARRHFRH